MSNCTLSPSWILGCEKSKQTQIRLKKQRIEKYYKDPKKCKNCQSIISYEKRDNIFCSCKCSGSLATKGKHHSEESKKKIQKSILKLHINKICKIKICRICGNEKCTRPEICSKRQMFSTLSKYFGFNLDFVGSIQIYDEWDRIKSILNDDYNVLNLSSIQITEKYNYYDSGNMCGILTRIGIQRRTSSEMMVVAISKGRWKPPENHNSCYKHGWHLTWNNKKVYFRSSLEKQVCDFLDQKKIDYEVETKRIKYWSSVRKSFHIAIPDFYLSKYNLLLESKGLYFYNEQDVVDRFKAFIDCGYDFRFYLEGQNIEEILGDLCSNNSQSTTEQII